MGSVRPPPGLWCLLDHDVFDDELVNGKILGIGVGFGVLQETGDVLHRLRGPATYTHRQ